MKNNNFLLNDNVVNKDIVAEPFIRLCKGVLIEDTIKLKGQPVL